MCIRDSINAEYMGNKQTQQTKKQNANLPHISYTSILNMATTQVDTAERDAVFERLRAIPENNICIDCEKKHPKWASVYFGIFICLDCAGKHREYGYHLSFVRSLTLDGWTRRQLLFMEHGGNKKALDFFKKMNLNKPIDYKNVTLQRFKEENIKKIDAIMDAENKASQPIPENRPVAAPVITAATAAPVMIAAASNKENLTNNRNEIEAVSPSVGIKQAESPTKVVNNNKLIIPETNVNTANVGSLFAKP
eukprot:TRINITY_DN526_c0_g3_i22.p1 TRINITY_DN526_c0_g3~~TRINITY_DN526_c0_g3_i22.p1  ORF type:complete len:259 (-),score=82.13 TRINITY_DN526_c0_g3_i22:1082-1834(-)